MPYSPNAFAYLRFDPREYGVEDGDTGMGGQISVRNTSDGIWAYLRLGKRMADTDRRSPRDLRGTDLRPSDNSIISHCRPCYDAYTRGPHGTAGGSDEC